MTELLRGTIRSQERWWDSHWDWDWLDGCFGTTKISPSDIDVILERNGVFLVFETKKSGEDVPMGQQILLRRLSQLGGGRVFIFILWGSAGYPARIARVLPTGMENHRPTTRDDVRALVARWFEYANREAAA